MALPNLPQVPSFEGCMPYMDRFEGLKAKRKADGAISDKTFDDAIAAVNEEAKRELGLAESKLRGDLEALVRSLLEPMKVLLEEKRQRALERLRERHEEAVKARDLQYYHDMDAFMGSFAHVCTKLEGIAEPPGPQRGDNPQTPAAGSKATSHHFPQELAYADSDGDNDEEDEDMLDEMPNDNGSAVREKAKGGRAVSSGSFTAINEQHRLRPWTPYTPKNRTNGVSHGGTDKSQGKRPADDSPAGASAKRAKVAPAKTPQNVGNGKALRHESRTISFEEVYGDGRPEHFHKILDNKGKWYILKCEEHQVHFGEKNAAAGAAKHLNGWIHGNLNKTHELAFQLLGWEVLGCDHHKMTRNNNMVKKAFDDGYTPLNNMRFMKPAFGFAGASNVPRKEEKAPPPPAQVLAPAVEAVPEQFEGIADAVPGGLYYGYWAHARRKKYPIMILTWTSQEALGYPQGTFISKEMIKVAPRCYVVDKEMRVIKGWAPGYEDGGPHVNQRQFPVVWLEFEPGYKVQNVTDFRTGWLAATNLVEFDLYDPNRSVDPEDQSNRAREHYAGLKGFASFEAMQLAEGPGGSGRRASDAGAGTQPTAKAELGRRRVTEGGATARDAWAPERVGFHPGFDAATGQPRHASNDDVDYGMDDGADVEMDEDDDYSDEEVAREMARGMVDVDEELQMSVMSEMAKSAQMSQQLTGSETDEDRVAADALAKSKGRGSAPLRRRPDSEMEDSNADEASDAMDVDESAASATPRHETMSSINSGSGAPQEVGKAAAQARQNGTGGPNGVGGHSRLTGQNETVAGKKGRLRKPGEVVEGQSVETPSYENTLHYKPTHEARARLLPRAEGALQRPGSSGRDQSLAQVQEAGPPNQPNATSAGGPRLAENLAVTAQRSAAATSAQQQSPTEASRIAISPSAAAPNGNGAPTSVGRDLVSMPRMEGRSGTAHAAYDYFQPRPQSEVQEQQPDSKMTTPKPSKSTPPSKSKHDAAPSAASSSSKPSSSVKAEGYVESAAGPVFDGRQPLREFYPCAFVPANDDKWWQPLPGERAHVTIDDASGTATLELPSRGPGAELSAVIDPMEISRVEVLHGGGQCKDDNGKELSTMYLYPNPGARDRAIWGGDRVTMAFSKLHQNGNVQFARGQARAFYKWIRRVNKSVQFTVLNPGAAETDGSGQMIHVLD